MTGVQLSLLPSDQHPRERPTARAEAQRAIAFRIRIERYGVSVERVATLYRLQGGLCAVCRRPLGPLYPRPGGRSGWRIDHDNRCCQIRGDRADGHRHVGTACGRCVRGLLCNDCNMACGALESPLLARRQHYLESFDRDHPSSAIDAMAFNGRLRRAAFGGDV